MVLVGQALVAVFVLLADLGGRWPARTVTHESTVTGPVRPGDQVRPYDLRLSVPLKMDPDVLPEFDLPPDIPSRLTFTLQESEAFGSLLLINGEIRENDAARFDAFVAGLSNPPAAVALNSPGGNVSEALKIGKILRAMEADTIILPGMVCLSSCPYVLAGGIERIVSRDGTVGLHQHYYDAPRLLPVFFVVEDIQQSQGQTMAHLIEMGIDPGVMVHSLSTPPNDIYVLIDEELQESRLATRIMEQQGEE